MMMKDGPLFRVNTAALLDIEALPASQNIVKEIWALRNQCW